MLSRYGHALGYIKMWERTVPSDCCWVVSPSAEEIKELRCVVLLTRAAPWWPMQVRVGCELTVV